MSQLFPDATEDERDPREDQNEERRREEEIKGDKPASQRLINIY